MTLYIVFLQTVKKVESYEQINIQSIILSEAQCAKEERTVFQSCGRITVNGKVSQFSCKLDVDEKMWSVELGRMKWTKHRCTETQPKARTRFLSASIRLIKMYVIRIAMSQQRNCVIPILVWG